MKLTWRAIARSLWRDLMVPWAISAVLVTLVCLAMLAFGLWVWPAMFVAFVFIAVQRQKDRAMQQGPAEDPPHSGT